MSIERTPSPVRATPRISANKLGEYITARPMRRRAIIKDQKRPPSFIVPRYSDAEAAITQFLAAGAQDDSVLLREAERLMRAPAETPWETSTNQLCAEALELFVDLVDELPFDGVTLTAGDRNPPKLVVANVDISVRPELIVQGTRRNEPFVGAVKLCFSKNAALGEDAGLYVATTVHQYAAQHLPSLGQADYRQCYVIDVFAGEIHTAPRSFLRRRGDIEAACEEIGRAWAAL